MTPCYLGAVVFLCGFALAAEAAERACEPRDRILMSTNAIEAGRAYRDFFTSLESVESLLNDADTGIALQAAWEIKKHQISRTPMIADMEEFTYRSKECNEFIALLRRKINVAPPDWWRMAVCDLDVFPGSHHVSVRTAAKWPRLVESESGYLVASGVELRKVADVLRHKAKPQSIDIPVSCFQDGRVDSYVVEAGKDKAIVAGYCSTRGRGYDVICLNSTGRVAWKANVWVTGQLMFSGIDCHRVSLVEAEGTVYVFGASGGGGYLDAFDSATGRAIFRFSTSYWSQYSESWGGVKIKP